MSQSASTAIHSGQWVDIKAEDGGSFQGYMTLPKSGKGPAILLIQEIFGINPHIRGVAEQYATDGYVVLAPDLFWRIKPHIELTYDEAGFKAGLDAMGKLDFPKALADLKSSLALLRSRPEVTGKIASVGFCLGGTLSFLTAATTDIDAAVSYYAGGVDKQLDKVAAIKAPMLFNFGAVDSHIPDDVVTQVETAFKGRNAKVYRYADADHGFNCWDRATYNQKAASLARGRTLEFLSENIG
jgi:carboxymethylenebutenolidase